MLIILTNFISHINALVLCNCKIILIADYSIYLYTITSKSTEI